MTVEDEDGVPRYQPKYGVKVMGLGPIEGHRGTGRKRLPDVKSRAAEIVARHRKL